MLRRSSRLQETKTLSTPVPPVTSYPDGEPVTEFENLVARLNSQSFPSLEYGRIDDIVVYALFASKKNFSYYRRLEPASALDDPSPTPANPGISSRPGLTNEQAITFCRLYNDNLPVHKRSSEESIASVARLICSSLPDIFGMNDLPLLTQ
jgi:hypothetical protein